MLRCVELVVDEAVLPMVHELVEGGLAFGRDREGRTFEHPNLQTGAQRKCAERDLTPGEGEPNATAQIHAWSRGMNRLRRSDPG